MKYQQQGNTGICLGHPQCVCPSCTERRNDLLVEKIAQRFRNLEGTYQSAMDAAVTAEREACARLAETLGAYSELNVWGGGPDWYKHAKSIAAAIRERGK